VQERIALAGTSSAEESGGREDIWIVEERAAGIRSERIEPVTSGSRSWVLEAGRGRGMLMSVDGRLISARSDTVLKQTSIR
jgi:hypothetical protein